jgi:hypothetical protein
VTGPLRGDAPRGVGFGWLVDAADADVRWQRATCIDEWTMAACNLATGATLVLVGGGAHSFDNLPLKRNPGLPTVPDSAGSPAAYGCRSRTRRFPILGSPIWPRFWPSTSETYSYYRRSVVTPFHSGPVTLLPDGSVNFRIYLDGRTSAAPAHIMKAKLTPLRRRAVRNLQH